MAFMKIDIYNVEEWIQKIWFFFNQEECPSLWNESKDMNYFSILFFAEKKYIIVRVILIFRAEKKYIMNTDDNGDERI